MAGQLSGGGGANWEVGSDLGVEGLIGGWRGDLGANGRQWVNHRVVWG